MPIINSNVLNGNCVVLSPEKKNKRRRRSCVSGRILSISMKSDQPRSDPWRGRKRERRQRGETGGLQTRKGGSSEPGEGPAAVPEDSCASGRTGETAREAGARACLHEPVQALSLSWESYGCVPAPTPLHSRYAGHAFRLSRSRVISPSQPRAEVSFWREITTADKFRRSKHATA